MPGNLSELGQLVPRNARFGQLIEEPVIKQEAFFKSFSFLDWASILWVLGILFLLIYSGLNLLRLKKKLEQAEKVGQGIYQHPHLSTAFVMGVFKPRIYLPQDLGEQERAYILLHEKIHIQRKDPLIKVIAYLALILHWFNPLVWLSFHLMTLDMELSCDEKVLEEMGGEIKESYAHSLVNSASLASVFHGSPVAFGKGDLKKRIKNIMKYRKASTGFLVLGFLLVIIAGLALGTNSAREKKELASKKEEKRLIELEEGESKAKKIAEEFLHKKILTVV